MELTAENFWQYCQSTYPAHQKELITWQDSHGANVNLALFCDYLLSEQLSITPQQIDELHTRVMAFSSTFTQPLRQLRRQFKAHQTLLNNYDALRAHMIHAELSLERQEQAIIISLYRELLPTSYTGNAFQGRLSYFQQLTAEHKVI